MNTVLKRALIAIAVVVPGVVGTVAIGVMPATNASGHDHSQHSHPEGEPDGVQPGRSPRVFANGTTPSGVPWTAMEYPSRRGGEICIDVSHGSSQGGGCFIPGSATPNWGRSWLAETNESVVYGIAGARARIRVRFSDGAVVDVTADERGNYVTAGRGSASVESGG